jgi:chromosome partitioning protein
MFHPREGGHLKKIAFHIEKGGTGKTTMTGNVAAEARRHRNTLMVDGDPQGNLSSWYVTDEMQSELADVLQGSVALADAIIELRPGLSILPTFPIGGDLKDWAETALLNKPMAFPSLLAGIEKAGFELCIFDLGPGISFLERSILAQMDEVIGVASAEYFAADGLEVFEAELEKLRTDWGASFVSDKIIVNRFNRSYAQHRTYLDWFQDQPYTLYHIGQSQSISDCVMAHQHLSEYEPGNKNMVEIQRIVQAVIDGTS